VLAAAIAMSAKLVAALRKELKARADGERARAQQAYMKSAMPYYGVTAPELRKVWRSAFDAHPLPTFDAWLSAAASLWASARFREERYSAIALTGHRLYRVHQTLDALPLYERFVVEGACWDYVDDVAVHRVGPLLQAFPGPMRRTLLAWSKGDDLWKRRTSIIAQVLFKQETDFELVRACIEPSLGRREFWLRKAIGWSLRAYAWHAPAEVKRYVKLRDAELSPLSKREALKNV
jgi:3-methyladenine DNA glycosylase AlkD